MKATANIIRLEETDSTNDHAWRLMAESKLPEFTVVSARFQSKGKGQGNNSWHSRKAENILASVVLYPDFLLLEHFFYLNKITALSIASCLEKYLPAEKISIKWPNDIYVNENKIAGILIQNELGVNGFSKTVAGMGININQADFPEELPNPVSLFLLTRIKHNLDSILLEIIDLLFVFYQKLKEKEFQFLDEAYLNRLYGLNELRTFRDHSGNFQGIIKGVRHDGKLMVEKEGTGLLHFDFKEIIFC
ncbi:MAG: biotin--[acetyl-CoA-carboxylase] ligase [Sphingobacteriales bacterium]|nr:biotin--[acetyl-CoA-carboxylase] ligase [Sphingobacteriales bacterium]